MSAINEGDIITIDGYCQAPYKGDTPRRDRIKPLPMKMVNGSLRVMLDPGYAPVMESSSANGSWALDGYSFVLGHKSGIGRRPKD